jgi:uncharacterized lipoprotein YddW (UPF0748 family)
MRCKWTFIFLVTLVIGLSGCRSEKQPKDVARPESGKQPAHVARPSTPTPVSVPTTVAPKPVTPEMRGIWISDPRGLDWERVMSDLRGAGFNTLFVNFNTGGAAFYPSRVLPVVGTRDEMRLCLDAARAAGIQVHAKFIVWYMFQSPRDYQRRMEREKRLLLDTKGKTLVQGDWVWLNPAPKINRQDRLAAITEALQNYTVAGVQLDYIRYPDNAGAMTSGRINLNTQFLADVRAEMQRLRPGIPLSVSNFYDYGRARNEMGQDWVYWAHKGYVDFLCPMNYTRDPTLLDKWIRDQQRLIKGKVPIYCGLGAYMLASPQQLNDQIAVTRRANLSGFVVFAYNPQFRQVMLPGVRF